MGPGSKFIVAPIGQPNLPTTVQIGPRRRFRMLSFFLGLHFYCFQPFGYFLFLCFSAIFAISGGWLHCYPPPPLPL